MGNEVKKEVRQELGDKLVRYYGALLNYCFSLTKDRMDAEDLCQDTIVKALNAEYQERGQMYAWLQTIALRTYLNEYWKQQRLQQVSEYMPDPYQDMNITYDIDYKMITSKIGSMPGKRWKVIGLYLAGYKYREIAEMSGMNFGTVKSSLCYSKKYIIKAFSCG